MQRFVVAVALFATLSACLLFSGGPEVVCGEPQPQSTAVGLTCEASVEAAIDVLPADHADIIRIVFYRALPCPDGAECPMTLPNVGGVVFETTNPVWWDVAWVEVDDSGTISAEYGGPVRAGFPND